MILKKVAFKKYKLPDCINHQPEIQNMAIDCAATEKLVTIATCIFICFIVSFLSIEKKHTFFSGGSEKSKLIGI